MSKFKEIINLKETVLETKNKLKKYIKLSKLRYLKLNKKIMICLFGVVPFIPSILFSHKMAETEEELTLLMAFINTYLGSLLIIGLFLFFLALLFSDQAFILTKTKIKNPTLSKYFLNSIIIKSMLTNKEINKINKIKITDLEKQNFDIDSESDVFYVFLNKLKQSTFEEIEKEKDIIVDYASTIKNYDKQQKLLKIFRDKMKYKEELINISNNGFTVKKNINKIIKEI
jgi:hypothetical protein